VFDKEQAQAFLQRRFGNDEGYVATAIRFPWLEHQFKWPEEQDLLLNVVESISESKDVYVCPVLRKTKGRGKWNGLESRTVFADLDGGVIPEALLPYVEVVNSGTAGHFHAYIALTETISVQHLEAFNKALTAVTKGDKGKWVNNTLLRLPGTMNHKLGHTPVTVESLQSRLLDIEEVSILLKNFMPSVEDIPNYPTEVEIGSLKVIDMKLSRYLYDRMNEDSGKDRSSQSFHFISACYEAGLSDNEVFTAASNHMPTIEKFGRREDGIAMQVLYVKDYRQRKNLALISNLSRF